jgi:hypothetical protein
MIEFPAYNNLILMARLVYSPEISMVSAEAMVALRDAKSRITKVNSVLKELTRTCDAVQPVGQRVFEHELFHALIVTF